MINKKLCYSMFFCSKKFHKCLFQTLLYNLLLKFIFKKFLIENSYRYSDFLILELKIKF